MLAKECAALLNGRGMPDQQIYETTMEQDYPAPQLWDAVLRTMMRDIVAEETMREIWARYVLPSGFVYSHVERIFSNPMDTSLWAYINTRPSGS